MTLAIGRTPAGGQFLSVKDTGPGIPEQEIPRVLSGLGVSILSTSRGLMTDKDARRHKVGGEILCEVW